MSVSFFSMVAQDSGLRLSAEEETIIARRGEVEPVTLVQLDDQK